MKAFSSPTMLSKAGDTKSHTVQGGTSHSMQDKHSGVIPKSKYHTEKRTIKEADHARKDFKHRMSEERLPHIQNVKGASNATVSGEQLQSQDRISADMSLEAVVTISKGRNSDSPELHFTPSPPPSRKPTTPRPSSAQRFRRMVLDCRDSQS